MKKTKFTGLTHIRKKHQIKVFNLLKFHDDTCPSLSKQLGLSKVALYRILDEMQEKELIKVTETVKTSVGRHPAMLSLNADFGYFAAVDFSPRSFQLIVFDIFGKILAQRSIAPIDVITLSDVRNTIHALKALLQELEISPDRLKQICICTPGRIDPNTGYFWVAARYEKPETINLKAIFSEYFPCNVVVKNDMQLALIGYSSYIKKNDFRNLLFIYLGSAIGSALFLDGKPYTGYSDTAGEFGSTLAFDGSRLSSKITLFGMCFEYERVKNLPKPISREEFVELFQAHDPTAVEIAQKFAKTLSIAINNLLVVLDVPVILISGDTCNLGAEFETMVNNHLKHPHFHVPPRCICMNNGRQSMLDGCIETAIDACIDGILSEDEELALSEEDEQYVAEEE